MHPHPHPFFEDTPPGEPPFAAFAPGGVIRANCQHFFKTITTRDSRLFALEQPTSFVTPPGAKAAKGGSPGGVSSKNGWGWGCIMRVKIRIIWWIVHISETFTCLHVRFPVKRRCSLLLQFLGSAPVVCADRIRLYISGLGAVGVIKAPHIFNEPSALCAGDMASKHRNRLCSCPADSGKWRLALHHPALTCQKFALRACSLSWVYNR